MGDQIYVTKRKAFAWLGTLKHEKRWESQHILTKWWSYLGNITVLLRSCSYDVAIPPFLLNDMCYFLLDLSLIIPNYLCRTTIYSEQDQFNNCFYWGCSESFLFCSRLSSAKRLLVQRRPICPRKYEPAVLLTQQVRLRTLYVQHIQHCREWYVWGASAGAR